MNTNQSPRILVAVDDSIPAQWAIQVAGQFATRLNAEVLLLNVVPAENPVGAEAVFAGTKLDSHERAMEESSALLNNARAHLPPGVNCEALTGHGDPDEQIIALATQRKVDLIVIGSRGQNRFAHFVLGSTAESVIRGAPCPVMTIANEPKLT